MNKLNYDKLMIAEPVEYMEVLNQANQKINFYEHPIKGEAYPVIAICHYYKIAYCTDFWDTGDFFVGSDYLPIVNPNGEMVCAFELEDYEIKAMSDVGNFKKIIALISEHNKKNSDDI